MDAEIRSITIDGQHAFELYAIYESGILYDIYYDLNFIEGNINEMKNIMKDYTDSEEFVEQINIDK